MKQCLCLLALAVTVSGQSKSTAHSDKFELASVKVNNAGGDGSAFRIAHGGLTAENMTLLMCIAWAYDVTDAQISGPSWLGDRRYDISAKSPNTASAESLRLMLQTLLAERFQLQTHRGFKDFPSYTLTVAGKSPKLTPAKPQASVSAAPLMVDGILRFNAITVKNLAERLPRFFAELEHQPVQDGTGLEGSYDFTLTIAADGNAQAVAVMRSGDPILGSILDEQLGLKLVTKKVSRQLIVVDHINQAPTAN